MFKNEPDPLPTRSQRHNKPSPPFAKEPLKRRPQREPPQAFFHLSEGNDQATIQAVFMFIDRLLADDEPRASIRSK